MPRRSIYGNEIHYETEGEGEPLILLHGLGSSSRDWQAQIPAFASSYRVVAPDFRGFGLSDKLTGPVTVVQMADDVRSLLHVLDIDRCHLLGFSMGGAVAYQMAVDDPVRYCSLCTLNSVSSFVPHGARERFEYLLRRVIVKLFGMKPLAKLVSGRLFPEASQTELRAEMAKRYGDNDRRSYLAALNALSEWSVSESLSAISCPALVISADQDYTEIDLKRDDVARMQNATLEVVANSRHATPMDQADALNRLVLDFLSTQGCSRVERH